jgi:hypothetical protein
VTALSLSCQNDNIEIALVQYTVYRWKGVPKPKSNQHSRVTARLNSVWQDLNLVLTGTLSTLFPTSIFIQSWLVEYRSISFAHISERLVNVSRRVTSYTANSMRH